MTKQFARMSAFALLLSVAVPLYAGAQTPAEIEAAKKAAPAKPAARPGPPPARILASTGFTEIARTSTSKSRGLGCGASAVRSKKLSGSAMGNDL